MLSIILNNLLRQWFSCRIVGLFQFLQHQPTASHQLCCVFRNVVWKLHWDCGIFIRSKASRPIDFRVPRMTKFFPLVTRLFIKLRNNSHSLNLLSNFLAVIFISKTTPPQIQRHHSTPSTCVNHQSSLSPNFPYFKMIVKSIAVCAPIWRDS